MITAANNPCYICGQPGAVAIRVNGGPMRWYCVIHLGYAQTMSVTSGANEERWVVCPKPRAGAKPPSVF